jgi:hypothetical protein
MAERVIFVETDVLHDVIGDEAYVLGFFLGLIMWEYVLV